MHYCDFCNRNNIISSYDACCIDCELKAMSEPIPEEDRILIRRYNLSLLVLFIVAILVLILRSLWN
jgi:hypothetical protein